MSLTYQITTAVLVAARGSAEPTHPQATGSQRKRREFGREPEVQSSGRCLSLQFLVLGGQWSLTFCPIREGINLVLAAATASGHLLDTKKCSCCPVGCSQEATVNPPLLVWSVAQQESGTNLRAVGGNAADVVTSGTFSMGCLLSCVFWRR